MTTVPAMDSIFRKVGAGIDSVFGSDGEKHSHSHIDHVCDDLHSEEHRANRYHSFQPETTGDVKWYVDGCSYFWAVSEALERELRELPPFSPSGKILITVNRGARGDFDFGLVVES